jgi:hypothetical protein
MDFLDEIHTTRWGSVCVFSNLLLILLAVASGVLESPLSTSNLPVILPQIVLIIPLLLQLLCLAIFTFSARSGALQLFKYQLQIPFLGRWMLPIIVIILSLICLGTLSRGFISATPSKFGNFFRIITLGQLVLHALHLLNLTWGFTHYLWTPRPRQYQPIHPSMKVTATKSNIRPSSSPGHLSRAYSSLSELSSGCGSHAGRTLQIPTKRGITTEENEISEIDSSNDMNPIQVIKKTEQ